MNDSMFESVSEEEKDASTESADGTVEVEAEAEAEAEASDAFVEGAENPEASEDQDDSDDDSQPSPVETRSQFAQRVKEYAQEKGCSFEEAWEELESEWVNSEGEIISSDHDLTTKQVSLLASHLGRSFESVMEEYTRNPDAFTVDDLPEEIAKGTASLDDPPLTEREAAMRRVSSRFDELDRIMDDIKDDINIIRTKGLIGG